MQTDDTHPLLGGSSSPSGAASGGSGSAGGSTTGARQRTAAAAASAAAGAGGGAGAAPSLAAPSPASANNVGAGGSGSGSGDNGSRASGGGSGDNSTSHGSGALARLLLLVHLVAKLAAYPLRKVAQLAFPPGPYDGLAAAAAADRAARDFCASFRGKYLTSAADGPSSSAASSPQPPPNPFSTAGYRATLSDVTSTTPGGGSSSSSGSPLLFVYLHSPHHPDCAAFCRDTLASARLIRYLHDGEARRAGGTTGGRLRCFGASVHSADGQHLAQSLGAVAYPFVGLVSVKSSGGGGNSGSSHRSGGGSGSGNGNGGGGPNYSLEVHLRLQGRKLLHLPPDTLLAYLQTVVAHHGAQAAEDEARRLHRDEAARLRREQDQEYQEALAADRAREAERQSAWEQAERERRHRAETERRARAERDEALAQARALVGDEPPAGTAEATTRIRLTLPNGRRIERRFRADDALAVVRAFLTVHCHDHGVGIAHFALSTGFPKRTYDDPTMTLREGGLVPQAVLMVQDLDA